MRLGLLWLARHRSADGSWSPPEFAAGCRGGTACEGAGWEEHETALTGLALLAFLGAGHGHLTAHVERDPVTGEIVRFRDVVRPALLRLLERQDDSGAIGRRAGKFHYGHAIATLALTEAYALSGSGYLKGPAERALAFLAGAAATTPDGSSPLGWRYEPGESPADTSVTGWAAMAMKSAALAGIDVPAPAMLGAAEFVRQATDAATGLVGYRSVADAGKQVFVPGENEDFRDHPAMTAVGMLIRIFAERDPDDPALALGAERIAADLPAWSDEGATNDYYYWYYASLALHQYDGPESPRGTGRFWDPWNAAMQRALVRSQDRGTTCANGSWEARDRWSFEGGRVYAVAINVLTLEVFYRYPNAFGTAARERADRGRGVREG